MKMKFVLFIFIAVVAIHFKAAAQPVATVIKTQAIEMGKALINNDMVAFK